jgi:hypothetical protein
VLCMNDFGYPIANWQDPEKYPKLDNGEIINWGWEFLRRNPDYQNDFVKFRETKSLQEKIKIKNIWLFKNQLINPKISRPRSLRFELSEYPRQIEITEEPINKKSIPNPFSQASEMGYVFNLDIPIKQQVSKVEKELKALQKFVCFKGEITIKGKTVSFDGVELKKIQKKHKTKLISFLRILDAKSSGVEISELLNTFYPKRSIMEAEAIDNLKKDIKAAKNYCKNYLSFFLI